MRPRKSPPETTSSIIANFFKVLCSTLEPQKKAPAGFPNLHSVLSPQYRGQAAWNLMRALPSKVSVACLVFLVPKSVIWDNLGQSFNPWKAMMRVFRTKLRCIYLLSHVCGAKSMDTLL